MAAMLCLVPIAALAQIPNFTQDFELLDMGDLDAMGNAGWVIYANVFDADGNYLYGYGTFPAPNNPGAPAFCNIVSGQGGDDQGAQQISVFSDYENTAHADGSSIEANLFREFTVSSADVGKTMTFGFEGKMGDLQAPSTAGAFIKTLDPANGYATTNLVTQDMTDAPTEWGGWTLTLAIDADLVGQLFQVGFTNTATDYNPSGIIYDNISLTDEGGSGSEGMVAYAEDFEGLNASDPGALGTTGWIVYGNVFDPSNEWLYGYGPNPAPNNPDAPAFSAVVTGEGGSAQGSIQMSVFSDYENTDHGAGNIINANVFREQYVGNDDIGKTWVFAFDAKKPISGGVAAPSTAEAYIKTIDPNNNFWVTNEVTVEMTEIGTEWNTYSVSLTIDAGLVGQIFQFGFGNTSQWYGPTTVIYDNVELREAGGTSAVETPDVFSGRLAQNYPNPFNPITRIEFSLAKAGYVDLAVYDIAGRLVANLVSEEMRAGDHDVTWNGTTRNGTVAASGQYYYVMKTAEGVQSRSMVLLK